MQATNAISPTTQDERITAALSHVTVVLSMIGILGPLLVYITQRDRSRFVAFHALQALVYQLSGLVIWAVGIGCYVTTFMVVMFSTGVMTNPYAEPWPQMAIPLGILALALIVWCLYMLYGIVAAVQTLQGKNFRYFLIGPVLEKSLNQANGR